MSDIIINNYQECVRLYNVDAAGDDVYTQSSMGSYLALLSEQPTANGSYSGVVLSEGSFLAAPDTQAFFDVVFDPVDAGEYTGLINVENDGIEDPYEYFVSGKAIAVEQTLSAQVENGRSDIYGVTVKDLVVGRAFPSPFADAEIKREVRNAATLHPLINFVSNMSNVAEDDKITCNFQVNLKDGSVLTVTEAL